MIPDGEGGRSVGRHVSQAEDIIGRSLPSITALRVFDSVCRTGSMSLASKELNVTVGAISRQIKILEAEVGAILFRRGNSNVAFTAAGEQLRNGVVPAFDRMESSCRETRDVNTSAPLTLVCLPSFTLLWLLPRLKQFEQYDPQTELRIISPNAREVDWGSGEFDAVIDVGRWPVSQDLMQTAFMQDRSGIVAAPQYWGDLVASAPDWNPKSGLLPNNATLLSNRTRPGQWARWMNSANVQAGVHREIWVDHLHMAIEAARLGLGLATAPKNYIRKDLEEGRLVAPFGFVEKPIPYYIAWPKRRSDDRRIRSLIAWLKQMGKESEEE